MSKEFKKVLEFLEAHMEGDIVGCIDAMVDNIYFAMGVLYKLGINDKMFERIFAAVHDANMEKKKGINPKRGDGSAADAIKPEGWKSPEDRIIDVLCDFGSIHK